MRIVYGAFAQGQGHLSKAAVLVPLLESRGHDVWVVSSGPERTPADYRFARHLHLPGLAYAAAGGRVQFGRSAWTWARQVPQVLRHLGRLRRLVCEFRPDLIISDFEPLSASPLLRAGCEVLAVSRQAALIDCRVPLPDEAEFERQLTRSVIRVFTAGADRLLGYHYAPESPRCLPPIVRPELQRARAEDGGHLLVYNQCPGSNGGSARELIEWASRRRCRVLAYGFFGVERGREGFVEFRPAEGRGFVEDLRTARAVITTAGFTTPVEAFLLGKPTAVVALPRQWEQRVNAFHLERFGVAAALATWDYDQTLALPPPASQHPLRQWLSAPATTVLDFLLRGIDEPAVQPPRRTPVPRAA